MMLECCLRARRPWAKTPVGAQPSASAHRAGGFTLIELVIVVAIIGVLSAAAFPVAQLVAQRAKESELRIALRQIRGAIDRYKQLADDGRIARAADATGYPPNLRVLTEGIPDLNRPDRTAIYLLRRLPRDPFADPDVPAEESWALRSYASPPSNPSPGRDVFDVYSKSTQRGLNGVLYREW